MTAQGLLEPSDRARMNGRFPRILAVAARSGEGPFTYPLQTPNHRALQTVVC